MSDGDSPLPDDLRALVAGAVTAGEAESEPAFVAAAVRDRFDDDPALRRAAAAALYADTDLTVGAAARLADVDRAAIPGVLRDHGVEPRVGSAPGDASAVRDALDGGDG